MIVASTHRERWTSPPVWTGVGATVIALPSCASAEPAHLCVVRTGLGVGAARIVAAFHEDTVSIPRRFTTAHRCCVRCGVWESRGSIEGGRGPTGPAFENDARTAPLVSIKWHRPAVASLRAWNVLGALTVNVAPLDHHERYSDRDHGNRDGRGDPSVDQRHGTAEHQDNGHRQQSEIPRRRLSGRHSNRVRNLN
jgi:hypothetical protein